MNKYPICSFFLCIFILITSCNSTRTANSPVKIKTNRDFKVIGYFSPVRQGTNTIASIPYKYLTHINYSFAKPTPDNSGNLLPLPFSNSDSLHALVRHAHKNDVEVFISVGGFSLGDGPGIDTRFEVLANSERTRTNFAHAVMQMVREFNLDGADIDWEFPDPVEPSASNFILLMKELRDSLHNSGKKITTAVESHHLPYVYGIKDEVFEIADWINIMGYDNEGIGSHRPNLLTPHSPYWLAIESFDHWVTKRGLAKEKAVMGVPFYGKGTGRSYHQYRALLARGADPYADVYDSIYYNGIKTMQEKTKLAQKRGAGIMIWEISGDTTGQHSLLKAIHDAIE